MKKQIQVPSMWIYEYVWHNFILLELTSRSAKSGIPETNRFIIISLNSSCWVNSDFGIFSRTINNIYAALYIKITFYPLIIIVDIFHMMGIVIDCIQISVIFWDMDSPLARLWKYRIIYSLTTLIKRHCKNTPCIILLFIIFTSKLLDVSRFSIVTCIMIVFISSTTTSATSCIINLVSKTEVDFSHYFRSRLFSSERGGYIFPIRERFSRKPSIASGKYKNNPILLYFRTV